MNIPKTTQEASALLADIRKQTRRRQFNELDDVGYFAAMHKTPDGVVERILVERLIVRQMVDDLLADPRVESLRLHDGEDWANPEWTRDRDEIMRELMACDEENLMVALRKPDGSTKHAAIYLVYGNDGWDVIADNSASLEGMWPNADALADALCLVS